MLSTCLNASAYVDQAVASFEAKMACCRYIPKPGESVDRQLLSTQLNLSLLHIFVSCRTDSISVILRRIPTLFSWGRHNINYSRDVPEIFLDVANSSSESVVLTRVRSAMKIRIIYIGLSHS
jgi:hypothetical protein